jgi:hypothetical protein
MAPKVRSHGMKARGHRTFCLPLAFRIGLAGIALAGCAGTRDVAATAGSAGAPAAPTGSAGAPAAPTADSSNEAQGFEQQMAVAEKRAIADVEAGDVAAAEGALRPLLGEAASQDDGGSYLHHSLAWLAWARGDYEAALEENRKAREAAANSRLMGHMSVYWHVSLLWQRAFLLLEQAAHTSPGARSSALSRARQAIGDCREAAEPVGKLPEADLLTSLYARSFGGRAASFRCDNDDDDLTWIDQAELFYAVIELCRGREGAATERALQALKDARQAVPSVERALFLQRARGGR